MDWETKRYSDLAILPAIILIIMLSPRQTFINAYPKNVVE